MSWWNILLIATKCLNFLWMEIFFICEYRVVSYYFPLKMVLSDYTL